jgi:hypothetical protein
MRLILIPIDKSISINGEFLNHIDQDLSWIPSNIHAVQWYDTWGEVEYNDGTPNQRIEELGVFEQAIVDFDNEKKLREEYEKLYDYWIDFRLLRNQRLLECDWTQVPDAQITDDKKTAWQIYRQQLRDLPENVDNVKEMCNNPNHPDWPTKPY